MRLRDGSYLPKSHNHGQTEASHPSSDASFIHSFIQSFHKECQVPTTDHVCTSEPDKPTAGSAPSHALSLHKMTSGPILSVRKAGFNSLRTRVPEAGSVDLLRD